MRAVVTGATGFVGSYLVKEMMKHNYETFAVVRSGSSNMDRLSSMNGVKIIDCDLRDIRNLASLINLPCDYFFHMAWEGVSGVKQMDYNIQIQNISYAIQAVTTAKELQCSRFIGAGSIHEIECQREMPQPQKVENQGNAYKAAKLAAHYYCKLAASKTGIDFLWPRLTNAYGPGEKSTRLINSVIRSLLSGEEPSLTQADQLYNFIYVSDAAMAYRLIAEKGISYGNYIIGSEEVKPLRDYLIQLRDIVAPERTLGFGKHEFNGIYLNREDLCNNIYRSTNFSSQVTFEEGIKRIMHQDFTKSFFNK